MISVETQLPSEPNKSVVVELPGEPLLVPAGLRLVRLGLAHWRMEVDQTLIDSTDVLVGRIPILHRAQEGRLTDVTCLNISPPAPFAGNGVEAMWTDLGDNTWRQALRPMVSPFGAVPGGSVIRSTSGIELPKLSKARRLAVGMCNSWPSIEDRETVWRPLEVRGGRVDVRATERGGHKASGGLHTNTQLIPERVARVRAIERPWSGRMLSVVAEELAARTEPLEASLGLVSTPFRKLGQRAAQGGHNQHTSIASWPNSAQAVYHACLNALAEVINVGSVEGDPAPMCELWRLYETWIGWCVLQALESRFGPPTVKLNRGSRGASLRASWSKPFSIDVLLQQTIGARSVRLTATTDEIISVSSDLRPDVMIVLGIGPERRANLLVIDAKKRSVHTSMDAWELAEAGSKYVWGIRTNHRDQRPVSRAIIATTGPAAILHDPEHAQIKAITLLPTLDRGQLELELAAWLTHATAAPS
jgi:hypothetical protein